MTRNEFLIKYPNNILSIEHPDFKSDLNILIQNKVGFWRMFKHHLPILYEHLILLYPHSTRFAEIIYLFIHGHIIVPVCELCQLKNPTFISTTIGFHRFCSTKCLNNSDSTVLKKKQTMLDRHGVEYPTQSALIYNKTKQTNLEKYGAENVLGKGTICYHARNNTVQEKYGVDNVFQSQEIKNTTKATNIQRHGVENPQQNHEIRAHTIATQMRTYGGIGMQSPILLQKAQTTNLQRYGTINPFSSPEIQNKIKQTMIERYGVSCMMHLPEFVNKRLIESKKRKKQFIFKNGDVVTVMGYEPFALQILQDMYSREDIVVESNLPTIWYSHNNSTRRYYPDIYIKSTNTIIEVKSAWTITLDVEMQQKKKEACISQGFLFQNWIISTKGEIISIV